MTPERWQQIEQLYHAALARDANQRAAFLRDACPGDDALRHEVESLLAQENGADTLLETPALEAAAKIFGDQHGQSLIGRQIGSYQVISLLGAGGMGEVYRARDTRLDRTVAIKILSDHLADRAELRERFDREARTIASLNHAHICTLYDIGRQDGTDYLVMEYLEGETLAQRLLKGPLPLDQVLQYAIEIADALDKAHRKGITHRDLKPGNIMLTKTGTKLLDFGLAKLKQEVAPANVPLSQLPTAQDPLTAQGTIVGTLQYMAPEQLEGKEVDARIDIFAFGAVVYEMATGKRAFEGKSQASLIGAILKDDPPPMSSLQPMTPPALDRVVRKCLAKEPEKRWQGASDLCDELKWIAEGGSQVSSLPIAPGRGIRTRWRGAALLWGGASLLLAAIIGLAVWNLRPQQAQGSQSLARMVIALPGEHLLGADASNPIMALSPDGSRLVSVVRRGGSTQLYLRRLDQLEFAAIPETEGAINPFFSPDSQWIGFFSVPDVKLKKVSAAGGAPQILCDSSIISGASWGPNDTIIFSPSSGNAGLYQVPAAGGKPQILASPDSQKGETSYSWPEFLPDGKSVLFSVQHGSEAADDAQIVVQSLETGMRRGLIAGGVLPRYVPTGHLVYVRAGTLMAIPFDLKRLEVTSTPVPIQEGLRYTSPADFSFSSLGWLVYVPRGEAGTDLRRLVWVDRRGLAQPLAAAPRNYQFPRLSPDGQRIAVQIQTVKSDIWVYDLTRDTLSRLTSEGSNSWPIWTPDGKRVTFASNKGGHENLFWKLADGSGTEERLTTSEHGQNPRSWSPDGRELVFEDTDPMTGEDIWVLSLQGDRNSRPFLRTPFSEGWAALSPDGRWLAYVSKELARSEIYVQPFPNAGGRWQISTEGGTEPVWARNGRELFYRSGDKMMAVDIGTQPTFTARKPRLLFESAEYERVSTTPNYDVSLDGQRFLMVEASEQQSAPQINVVLNWFGELKQKVPTGKK